MLRHNVGRHHTTTVHRRNEVHLSNRPRRAVGLVSLTETFGRLTRRRLRLAEFDFSMQYWPGRVHQVPSALSRLTQPRAVMELQCSLDDDIPGIESDDDVYT